MPAATQTRKPQSTKRHLARQTDARDAQALGRQPYGSAYRTLLGPSPVCRPDERQKAAWFVSRIERALNYEGRWTHAERRRLRQMRTKWQRRAQGLDARFLQFGTQPGRLDKHQTHLLTMLQAQLDARAALVSKKEL